MTPEQWARIEELFARVHELPPAEREPFLASLTGEDAGLREEVLSLLAEQDQDSGLLDTPPPWAPAATIANQAVPETIGPYRLVRELGRGGMGRVFLAEREAADVTQQFALKLMRRGLDTEDLIARFRTERKILARLDHPSIARLFDAGTTPDGLPFFVMEFVGGSPLLEYCDERRLTIEERLRLFQSLCAAVHYAHRSLIVHRDIKPHNVLVKPDGVPKLLDFGIAKILAGDDDAGPALTRTQLRMLTPEYAAPEQIRGDPVTTSCDVYALGVLLYELLAGRHPCGTGLSRTQLERAVLDTDPPPPSAALAAEPEAGASTAMARRLTPAQLRQRLAGDLDTVVLKALRKEPEARYSSALAFSEDIERQLTGLPVQARPATLRYRARKFVARNRAAVAAAVALFLVLSGATVITLIQDARIRAESTRVERERDKALEVRGFLLEMFGTTGPDQATGDSVTARQLLDRRAASLTQSFADDAEMRAEMLNVLAEGYEKLGLFEQAEPLARQALETRRTLFGSAHPDVAVSLNLLGWLLHERGRSEEAEPLLREAVAVGRQVFPPEGDNRLARALNDLGIVRDGRGDYDEAAALYRESLEMRRRTAGDDHIGIAITRNNLSILLYRTGDIEGAIREQEAALELFRRTLGPDHQRTTVVQTNLAAMHGALGRHEDAARLHREILERRTRMFGAAHASVAVSRTMLANELAALGNDREAEPLLEEALRVQRHGPGTRPEDMASSLRVLADLKMRAGRATEALLDYREAIQLLETATASGNADLAVLYGRVANAYEAVDRLADAERAHETAAQMMQRVLGPAHSWTAEIKFAFVEFLKRRGLMQRADSILNGLDGALADGGAQPEHPLRERIRSARPVSAPE